MISRKLKKKKLFTCDKSFPAYLPACLVKGSCYYENVLWPAVIAFPTTHLTLDFMWWELDGRSNWSDWRGKKFTKFKNKNFDVPPFPTKSPVLTSISQRPPPRLLKSKKKRFSNFHFFNIIMGTSPFCLNKNCQCFMEIHSKMSSEQIISQSDL